MSLIVSEKEYEYCDYGRYKDTNEIIVKVDLLSLVAGGGMMRSPLFPSGNAYATILEKENDIIYTEYGPKGYSERYCNSMLDYDDDGYGFDIVSRDPRHQVRTPNPTVRRRCYNI